MVSVEISDWNDLDDIRLDLDSDYILVNDLDDSTTGYTNIGDDWEPILSFSGTLDGDNFTISNLIINKSSENSVGFFGYMGSIFGSDLFTIKNINFNEISVTGKYSVGGLIGSGSGSTSAHSLIQNVSITGYIYGWMYVGGMVGISNKLEILESNTDVTVDGSENRIGGFVGATDYYTKINKCFAKGTVISDNAEFSGGFVGVQFFEDPIEDCYFIGTVNGTDDVGGFAGRSRAIKNCYCVATVTGNSNISGFVSEIGGGLHDYIENCFWNTTVGPATSTGGTGKTTTEMKDIDTYTDTTTSGLDEAWDFTDIWDIDTTTNDGYPFFKVEVISIVGPFPTFRRG